MENEHTIYDLETCRNDIKKALKFAYDIKKKRGVKGIPYDGVELTHHSILGVDDNITEALSEDSLEYHKERGRKPLDVILTKMFQLGYQNGYLMAKKEGGDDTYRTLYKYAFKEVENMAEIIGAQRREIEALKEQQK